MKYPNFYETLKEALMRLRKTVVCYDGVPYQVLTITNHKPDGIFRIYLAPLGYTQGAWPEPDQFPPEHDGIGPYMDEWMVANPNVGILRKQMNSPLFNKFRPYPLGMVNMKGDGAFFIERQPNRKTEQGLIASMLYETKVSSAVSKQGQQKHIGNYVSVYSEEFKNCVMGNYPSAGDCLEALTDPNIMEDAAAFNRKFAFCRGPLGMLFLVYKWDVIGLLTHGDFSHLRLGREFRHTLEVVQELDLFQNIK